MKKQEAKKESTQKGRKVTFTTYVKTSSSIKFESVNETNKEYKKDDLIFEDKAVIVEIEKLENGNENILVSFEFTKGISNIDKVKIVNGYGFKEV